MSALNWSENSNDMILRVLRDVISEEFTNKEIRPDMLLESELGITSLGKIAMAIRFEEEFGVEVSHSIKEIAEIRTVKELTDLARRIAEKGQGRTSNQLTGSPGKHVYPPFIAIQNSPFVAIQTDGAKPPFYACGHHPRLLNLAQALGSDQPFYKIDAYALVEERLGAGYDIEGIEEMADHFVQNILAAQPSGPYYLGGGCEGAIIAFEIAQQLESLGHKIAMLVIWDTPTSNHWRKDTAPLGFSRRLRRLFSEGPAGLKRGVSFFVRKARSVFTYTDADRPSERNHTEQVLIRTVRNYVGQRYGGRIILFRAKESDFECSEPTLGWGALTTEDVELKILPGSHTTYFEHNFLNFAEMLKLCLTQQQTNNAHPMQVRVLHASVNNSRP